MKTRIIRLFIIVPLLSAMWLYGCKDNKGAEPGVKESAGTDSAGAEKKEGEKGEEKGGALHLSAEQMKAVGIETGPVEKKNLHAVVRASGELAVPPQYKADVNVLMGGIIRTITVLEGQAVRKGQVLATLENTDFVKLQQEYLTLKSQFTYTQEELTRQKELSEAGAGTGKNLQQVQANYNAEMARMLALEKQLQQLGIDPVGVAGGHLVSQVPVTAPIGGTIGHITVNTGTYAETGKPLMEIIDNSKIHCDLVVFEKDLFKVRIGQQVNFILTNQNNQAITGKIFGINKSFEADSKGIIVHAVIEGANKYRLIPGMYVTALIDVGNQETTAAPVDAVVRSEGKDYIFVVEEEEGKKAEGELAFKKVEVVTGESELGYVQITPLEDLEEGARIVKKGAFYLLSKQRAKGENND